MRTKLQLAITCSFFLASSAFAQDNNPRVPLPSGLAAYLPPKVPTPSDGEAEDIGRQVAPHRNAYVAPTNYETLGPKPSDYPTESWVAGHEGDVGYTLYVGEDGKPKACEVTESSGFELLDMQACKLLMERSKFEPAIDADGNRVSGEFSSRYRWAKREPEFPGTLTVHVAYTVNEDGTLTDCETIEISGSISERMQRQIEREPCPGINGTANAPFRDQNGVPVAKRVKLLLQVEVEDFEQ